MAWIAKCISLISETNNTTPSEKVTIIWRVTVVKIKKMFRPEQFDTLHIKC